MPDLTIAQNLTPDQLQRIVDAFVERQGPIPMTPGVPAVLDGQGNVITPAVPPAPMFTPGQFARRKIMDYIKTVVANSEREVAAKVVAATAQQKAIDDFQGV